MAEPGSLPPDFQWQYVAETFQSKLRKLRARDSDLRAILQTRAEVEAAETLRNLEGVRQAAVQERARGWKDDPEVQKLLEQVQQEEPEPEIEELGEDDDFAFADGGGDGPTT